MLPLLARASPPEADPWHRRAREPIEWEKCYRSFPCLMPNRADRALPFGQAGVEQGEVVKAERSGIVEVENA